MTNEELHEIKMVKLFCNGESKASRFENPPKKKEQKTFAKVTDFGISAASMKIYSFMRSKARARCAHARKMFFTGRGSLNRVTPS